MEMSKTTKIIIGVVCLVIIIAIVIGAINKSKNTPKIDVVDGEVKKNTKFHFEYWHLFVLIFGIAFLWLLYFFFKTINAKKTSERITVDQFMHEVVIPRLIKQNKIRGLYVNDVLKELPGQIMIIDQKPFSSITTGERIAIIEFKITTGLFGGGYFDGLNIVMGNLDTPKEHLIGGDYAMHTHTHIMQFFREKSMLKKFPVTSPQDVTMRLMQLMNDEGYNLNEVRSMINENQGGGNNPQDKQGKYMYNNEENQQYDDEDDEQPQPKMIGRAGNNRSRQRTIKRRWF